MLSMQLKHGKNTKTARIQVELRRWVRMAGPTPSD
jgi:hypothetical protein